MRDEQEACSWKIEGGEQNGKKGQGEINKKTEGREGNGRGRQGPSRSERKKGKREGEQ